MSKMLLMCSLGIVTCGAMQAQDDKAISFRVMSFNIRYGTAPDGENEWRERKDLVSGTILAFRPDILGLQEALRFQLDDLQGMVPDFTEIGVGRDDGQEAGEYAAILVRTDRFLIVDGGTYWLSDTPELPGSMTWGNRIPRVCTWVHVLDKKSGSGLYVFNTHWDHESQESRMKSAELLLQSIQHFTDVGDPVIVMGDFNAGEKNPAFLKLLSSHAPPLRDSYRALHPKATGVGTYHGFKGERGGEKIDAILVSDHWTVLGAEIVRTSSEGRYPSDHFPVTARIRRQGIDPH